ncbi:hypothetical protein ABR737_01335 [Streptomyces sp. Edi2]|uniref:hypothetical protein n=1 Tax=Streptomyces sp. Edi2 TaxID=3162528 RepID=UPI003305D714
MSRAIDRAVDAVSERGQLKKNAARAARPHLAGARFLYQRIADRYVADAWTGLGRMWRRRQVRRSAYTQAFEEAQWYLNRREREWEGPFVLPPLFLRHPGEFPLLERLGRHRAPAAAI